jgi:hypothetical protein
MTHRGLSGSQGDAPLAQERSECGSQGVNVEGSVSLVALGDSRKRQVPVENANQSGRHGEDGEAGRETGRDWLAKAVGVGLERRQHVVEPLAQVGRQVRTDHNAVPLPVLFVRGVEFDVRHCGVEPELTNRQRGEFALAKSG